MGYAASLYNMMRNAGAAIGVSYMTTTLVSHQQIHQSYLVEHFSVFDAWRMSNAAPRMAGAHGFAYLPQLTGGNHQGFAGVYGMIQAQASMLSFNDIYRVLAVWMMLLIPSFLLLRRVGAGGSAVQLIEGTDLKDRVNTGTCQRLRDRRARTRPIAPRSRPRGDRGLPPASLAHIDRAEILRCRCRLPGNPMLSTLRSDARRSELRVEARRFSSDVRPPRCMLAAWMTSFALSLPPVVTAASPKAMLPMRSHSC